MYQLVRLAQLIGLNAVPGFGFFRLHWTAGTVIALYWVENLLGSLLIAARIDIHRRLTHKRGHYVSRKSQAVTVTIDGKQRQLGTIFASFVVTSIVFTLTEGIFLAVLLANLPDDEKADFHTLRFGLMFTAAFLVSGFVFDLIGIRERPFFWIHRLADGMLSRVFVLFFVVLLGIFAITFFNAPRVTVVVFMVLKTFIDISSELPESQSGEAPQWQLAIAGLFGPAAREKFAVYARDANKQYGTYRPEDEQVQPG